MSIMVDPVTAKPCAAARGSSQAGCAGHDWRAGLERLRGAYADASIDGYAKDFRLFESWCAALGHSALPTTPGTIAAYLATDASSMRL